MQQIEERAAARPMAGADTYRTLLVHVEPGLSSGHRVEAAARLARHLDAHLIGLGAETFDPLPAADPFSGYAAGDWVAFALDQVTANLQAAEAAFRRDAAGADIEWRQARDYPDRALCSIARAADLIVVSPSTGKPAVQSADAASVAMGAGLPVLVVPEGRSQLRAQVVSIAWKDTRECRRAIADARPLLRQADEVIVHAVGAAWDEVTVAQVDDVVANLKRHGVVARPCFTVAPDEGVTQELEKTAAENGADLIVAGAYGHSRLREWAFGGVTDDLLHRPAFFVLMSH